MADKEKPSRSSPRTCRVVSPVVGGGRRAKRGRSSPLSSVMEEESPLVEKDIGGEVQGSLPLVSLVSESTPVEETEIISKDESVIHMMEGEEVLRKTRIFTCFDCPPIPLCRMIPYAKVRSLREDISSLKIAFGKEGYMPEKGVFIVSIKNIACEEKIVDDDILSSWDAIWRDINNDFEAEIACQPALHMLSNRMFYVWEGNHRTVAWMEAIKEHYEDRKDKHVRILSTIIDPSKVSEISLLSCLQRMNFLNTQALVVTSLRDEIISTYNICAAKAEDYLNELPDEEVKIIMTIRKRYSKGIEPWFPLTRKYLARLVYNVQMTNELHKKMNPLKSTLSKEEYTRVELKEIEDLTRKFSDRVGKILNIIDPNLGGEWWQKVLSLKWTNDSFATLEKLNLVAMCPSIQSTTKVSWLALLEANKAIKASYGLPRGDHEYRGWLLREATLERIYERANNLLEGFRDLALGVDISQEFSLKHFFEEVRMEKRKFLFCGIVRSEGREKNVESKASKKLDLIQMGAQRLVYRYLLFLKEGGHIQTIPLACKPWLSLKEEATTMYPPSMHSLSKWEIENCPWWIDIDGGEILEREKEKHSQYGKSISKSGEKESKLSKKVMQEHPQNVPIKINKTQERIEIQDEDTQNMTSKGDIHRVKILKKSNTFVFIGDDNTSNGLPIKDHKCVAIAGDYIEIGKDFSCGKKNASYTIVHEHFMKHQSKDVECFRRGKVVSWAADLVFLDLPFGGVMHGHIPHPPWDVLTEEHVRYGISVAAASMADKGWLLIMASHEGNAIGWIEKYTRISDLVVWHRVFVMHYSSYGYIQLGSSKHECNASILYMVHRCGFVPSLYLESCKSLFESFHLQPLSSFVTHLLPINERAKRDDGTEWRGSMQISHTFLACYVEMLCPPGGMALEVGCGTAPLAQACLQSGRICASIDFDDSIISSYLAPLLKAKKMPIGVEASTSHIGDDDVDVLAGVSPYD